MKTQITLAQLSTTIAVLVSSGILITGSLPNFKITSTQYEVESSKIPLSFDGYKIVQVSDLHNASFGKNQRKLISSIKAEDPDLIVFTGDMVGSWIPDYQNALILIREAIKIAPVLVVDGNHDARLKTYPIQKQAMIDAGAIILEDESYPITIIDSSIQILGLKERFKVKDRASPIKDLVDSDTFSLLLAHHPENFLDYVQAKVDLVLVGHTHGGQFRFFDQGIYSPDQGLFPKYSDHLITQDSTSMIISRGLGESVLPLRLYNGPELVIITLRAKKNP
ncbi:MAG: metallophosphoesterase [Erysipelotrichaceae bacterium]|nr:metallophosphoesterase [Erysipelotrichaceae bacterium]